ncbi:hypothetical protein [Helicobacter sp. 13S00477-4]|uniref:hypothetical protein n=1 Tax=Helicobacter sp. 13S00477-4 TaxID=1905759 RepID=UPI000BA64D69|nr:hypothetical protein [Helicobacter sp. 13S00477-4]PAF52323.1 hypothetical protein BKH44_03180 [Helicobacter sp. 13S00477-4]
MKNLFLLLMVNPFIYAIALNPISIPKQNIPNIFDPQILTKPKLEMIINQKAKINGKWYQIGQIISKYQIIQIEKNFVVLKNKRQILTLKTHSIFKGKK